ncbi:MAG: DUF2330 domain-containing protein, partial [Deltaproteobacteria bacterium]|nr:DUF2330 domain-containing protein [Deltaproteobacteria bacterium]
YVLQIAVQGDASELGWLIPTPALPDAPVLADKALFDTLGDLTGPMLISCSGGSGACATDKALEYRGEGGVTVWAEGKLDNLEYAVLSATDGSDLNDWLQTHDYPTNNAITLVVNNYIAAGWKFVALKVSQNALQGDQPTLGPVAIHIPYTGNPVFPVKMSSLSATASVSLVLYIAAEELMAPGNYDLVTINKEALREDADGNANYNELLKQAIDAQGGGFVVEYAGAEPGISFSAPLLQGKLTGKKLVRLHTDQAPSKYLYDVELEVRSDLVTPSYNCVPREGEEAGGCGNVAPAGNALPLLALLAIVAWLPRRR